MATQVRPNSVEGLTKQEQEDLIRSQGLFSVFKPAPVAPMTQGPRGLTVSQKLSAMAQASDVKDKSDPEIDYEVGTLEGLRQEIESFQNNQSPVNPRGLALLADALTGSKIAENVPVGLTNDQRAAKGLDLKTDLLYRLEQLKFEKARRDAELEAQMKELGVKEEDNKTDNKLKQAQIDALKQDKIDKEDAKNELKNVHGIGYAKSPQEAEKLKEFITAVDGFSSSMDELAKVRSLILSGKLKPKELLDAKSKADSLHQKGVGIYKEVMRLGALAGADMPIVRGQVPKWTDVTTEGYFESVGRSARADAQRALMKKQLGTKESRQTYFGMSDDEASKPQLSDALEKASKRIEAEKTLEDKKKRQKELNAKKGS